ncbi:MAG: pyrroline-5-carboxylate reductase [Methylococcales bacterium]|jgi:pyrroline-5-carboxylate reductase|nr:pyrroline-5-carboxylate reductase [Methylococcales bacterium]MBT7410158.1 pyrroline-5-carboxylate reductase [Methylococcales bacterium]
MSSLENFRICFIGGGNMAESLIAGLINNHCPANNINVSDPNTKQLTKIKEHYSINVFSSNQLAITDADIIILAVKPQIMKEVATGLIDSLKSDQLIVSIAAGITCQNLQTWLPAESPLIRIMPNTPAQVQSGVSALYATPAVNQSQKEMTDIIFKAVGSNVWFDDEHKLHAVTAISGSGPAYFLLMIEAMENAAIDLGLEPDQARELSIKTGLGAAKLAQESTESPALLRENITSPGGTTEQALNQFEQGQLRTLVKQATRAAYEKSIELSEQLGGSK